MCPRYIPVDNKTLTVRQCLRQIIHTNKVNRITGKHCIVETQEIIQKVLYHLRIQLRKKNRTSNSLIYF